MEPHRLAPGERLNTGPPTEPRQAATIILVRGGAQALEVLLLQRNPAARFMGGAWVFPGGAVDPGDADHRAAAVRELAEEAGVTLPDPGALIPFSRWITPARADHPVRHALLRRPRARRPGAARRRRGDGRRGLVGAGGRARRRPRGRAAARLPDDQAPRAARALRLRGRAAELGRGREVVPVEPRIAADGSRIVLASKTETSRDAGELDRDRGADRLGGPPAGPSTRPRRCATRPARAARRGRPRRPRRPHPRRGA